MSVTDVVTRISQIQSLLSPRPATPAVDPSSFQASLQGATASSLGTASGGPTATAALAGAAPLGAPTAGTGVGVGAQMVALAQGEVGVAEQPPGSNDAPRIAEYRTATSGSGVGPWCAYFVSWLAKQAGSPIGEAGQGFGSVSAVAAWAQRTGRNLPAGTTPQPGDLIYWGGEHIGMVESVDPDGSIHTIEGNSSNAVTRRTYGADGGGATGYVRL